MKTTTYWRLKELSRAGVGSSKSDAIEALINERADALGIPVPTYEEAAQALAVEHGNKAPTEPSELPELPAPDPGEEIVSQHFTF